MTEPTQAALADTSDSRTQGELRALYRISHILTTDVRQKQMLAEVLDVLDAELGMMRGTILLLSPDGRELMSEVAHNLSEAERKAIRYQLGEGVTGRVVQTGRPQIVPKVSQEPRFLGRLHKRRRDPSQEISFLCVPIIVGTHVVGALSADLIYEEDAPLEEAMRVLTIVASMIANDVKVRREVQADRERLEE